MDAIVVIRLAIKDNESYARTVEKYFFNEVCFAIELLFSCLFPLSKKTDI
jgi:hypothetical protein